VDFTDEYWGEMLKFGLAAIVVIFVFARLLIRG
jgi:hypothetical protein